MISYPYDKKTGKIALPEHLASELKALYAKDGIDRIEALRKTVSLTGVGLEMAKEYLAGLSVETERG